MEAHPFSTPQYPYTHLDIKPELPIYTVLALLFPNDVLHIRNHSHSVMFDYGPIVYWGLVVDGC